MIRQMYAVRDTGARLYGNPFFSVRDEVAVRDFSQAVNDPQSAMYHAPEDFALYWLGSFDDESGDFVCAEPKRLCLALSVRKYPEVSE